MWNPFKRQKIQERAESSSSVTVSDELLKALFSPDAMTLEKAMSIPAFAGCVNLICSTAKVIPLRLYRHAGEDEDRVVPVPDDRRVKLVNDNTEDTLNGPNFKSVMVFDYLTAKGGYAYINKPRSEVRSINYVSPAYVSFGESPDHIFKQYEIWVDGKRYRPHQFLKLLRRTRDGYRGISVIDENRILLTAVYNALLLENQLVKKGGTKRGFLQSEKKLNQESINLLKDSFSRMYNADSEGTPVLNDGVKFQEASATSVELQLNENKKQNGTEICKIFGVPPRILEGGATEQDWSSFVQYTMLPIMEDFAQALNRDLLLEKEKGDYYWAADVSELTKGDIQKRFEAYKTAVSSGFLQIDEVRKKENLPALDLPFVKLGLSDVLLDPETGGVYTPNTGMWGSLKDQTISEEGQKPQIPPEPDGGKDAGQDEPEPEEPVPKGGLK